MTNLKSALPLTPGVGGGEGMYSGDRDVWIGAKINTQKNPYGFQQNPMKSPEPA